MKIDVMTIFPQMFHGPLDESILKRAQAKKLVEIKIHDLRNWAPDRHKSVDDAPYGGGAGMVMRVDVIDSALRSLKRKSVKAAKCKTILMTPQGQKFNQAQAQELAKQEHLILVAGHYEGVDERVRQLADEEISIGDYVLTGGELPAMVVVDSVVRLIPGVLGKEESLDEESFTQGFLEYPHYTRPEEYKGMKVPEVLLSGNHAEIAKWRKEEAEKRTRQRRPDLLLRQQ